MSFEKALKHLLQVEGGYVNDPRDRGGETNLGVTQGTLTAARALIKDLPASVKDLGQDDVRRIYKALYWDAVKADLLPAGLAMCVFDSAVNQGVQRAIKALQRAVGTAPDGVLGDATLRAAKRLPEALAINLFMAERAMMYATNSQVQIYGKGWFRRLLSVQGEALAEAASQK